jgi:uncharacterized protein YyaL (SSP411 family)
VQLQEAYAFLLSGVLELYQATLETEHLEFAIALAESLIAKFQDAADGGFWQALKDDRHLILRVKEDYDGAEPSGNSVAAMSLLKLAAITERRDFREAADRTLALFGPRARQQPQAVANLLSAAHFAQEDPRRVVLAGDLRSAGFQALLHAAHSVYQPNKVVLGTSGPVEPFARTLAPKAGQATAFVCTGTSCKPPTHEAQEVARLLK